MPGSHFSADPLSAEEHKAHAERHQRLADRFADNKPLSRSFRELAARSRDLALKYEQERKESAEEAPSLDPPEK